MPLSAAASEIHGHQHLHQQAEFASYRLDGMQQQVSKQNSRKRMPQQYTAPNVWPHCSLGNRHWWASTTCLSRQDSPSPGARTHWLEVLVQHWPHCPTGMLLLHVGKLLITVILSSCAAVQQPLPWWIPLITTCKTLFIHHRPPVTVKFMTYTLTCTHIQAYIDIQAHHSRHAAHLLQADLSA